jgi:uncharacterized membrane protein
MGGSVSRGGGSRGGGGGGGGYRGGGGGSRTNIIVSPGYGYGYGGFSPFGFSPFGFSPFGGFGGFFAPPSWLLLGGLALIAFRTVRESTDSSGAAVGNPGAALLVQVGVNCKGRGASSMFGRMEALAASADTSTDVGLQLLVSDTCLALLRSSPDWVGARTVSVTAGFGASRDTESAYRSLLVGERAKWEREARRSSSSSSGGGGSARGGGGQTYMVVTVMALIENGSPLPEVSSVQDLRRALAQVAAEVSKDSNLVAADVLWTPQEAEDTLSREDMFAYFPELIDL